MDKSKTNFLSAVIITKNEAKNVALCLNSLKDVADEVIVVDSFSTDSTVEICRSMGAKVFQLQWEGYSRTKNKGNALASYDWILSIDADEVLSPELRNSILKIKQEEHGRFYSFRRLTNYCGHWIRHGGWYPDIKFRLFDRRSARWTGDYVHEQLKAEDHPAIILLEGDCLHYSFHSISQHVEQVNRYSALSAEDRFSRGKRASFGKLVFSPAFTFFSMYVLRLGMLDGLYGFIIAVISAYARFLRYARLFELQQSKNSEH
jgi:glycosyltransferase involved in cell wall biosynthesis